MLSIASVAAAGSDLRLVDAARTKDAEAVRSLLKQHADVNTAEPDGTTALAWAAHWDDVGTAELLVRAGANVNAANDLGVTPLWLACSNASAGLVEILVNAGAATNSTQLAGETALMRCARTGNVAAVQALLAHGANVNATHPQRGQTALMWALEERHPETARILIEHGADIHAHSKNGFTPLLYAARQGDLESASLLVEKGADVNEPAPGGLTALLVAADSGREALAIFLLEKGANPDAADPDGLTALHYSMRKGISILRGVVHDGLGADIDYLLRPNMAELVKSLLDHGANPNARIKADLIRLRYHDLPQLGLSGATPFLLAAATGDVGIMKTLLAKGADPKLATNDNTTPLMVAAGVGHREDRPKDEEKGALEAVKLMVELGADVNAANRSLPTTSPFHQVSESDGLTAMHGAAYTGANEIIQFLAEKGAKLDAEDRFGQTPLSIAEGDPNVLMDDHEVSAHPASAALIRKLGGDPAAR